MDGRLSRENKKMQPLPIAPHHPSRLIPRPSQEVWAGPKMETIATKSRCEASETDTQSDKNEAWRILERLRSLVGAETPNRELRDDIVDVILLPNGDPLGVHFWSMLNFERFLSDFGTA